MKQGLPGRDQRVGDRRGRALWGGGAGGRTGVGHPHSPQPLFPPRWGWEVGRTPSSLPPRRPCSLPTVRGAHSEQVWTPKVTEGRYGIQGRAACLEGPLPWQDGGWV